MKALNKILFGIFGLGALTIGATAAVAIIGIKSAEEIICSYFDSKKVEKFEKAEADKRHLYIENIIGGSAPEKYYKINGKKVFLEIDGIPVEEYFK